MLLICISTTSRCGIFAETSGRGYAVELPLLITRGSKQLPCSTQLGPIKFACTIQQPDHRTLIAMQAAVPFTAATATAAAPKPAGPEFADLKRRDILTQLRAVLPNPKAQWSTAWACLWLADLKCL
jgi:hypothetical protein